MAGNPCNIIPDQEIVLEGGAKLVPAPEAADAGKVLGVTNQEGGIGWVESQGGTVDQTYNASSTNAQSGTAVAQAIASIPSSSYTAGNGIEISNGKIAVRAGDNLIFANTLVTNKFYSPVRNYPEGSAQYVWSFIGQLNTTRINQLQQGLTIKIKEYASLSMTGATGGAHFAICRKNSDNTPKLDGNVVLIAGEALSTDTSKPFYLFTETTRVANFSWLSPKSVGHIYDIGDDADQYYLTIISYAADGSVSDAKFINGFANSPDDINTSEYYTENPDVKELVALNQLPMATSYDTGKVLTVNSNGGPDWQTPSSVTVDQTYNASSTNAQSGTAVAEAIAAVPVAPTYSEGDGIDITNNVISADVDGTTIGIDSTTHKIKSLQTIPTKTSDLQNDSGFITSSDVPAQVQANWNESDSSSAAYIQNKPTIPPGVIVDQTYNASSTNAQSGVAVASAVAGVNAVPASTSSDENKVLTVNSSGTPVWAASSVPASKPLVQGSGITITDGQNDVTISANADQNYSASSTNAQSGVAVASALAGVRQVPASTSADEDKVLTVNSSGTPVWAAAQGGGGGSGDDSEFPYDPGYMHTGWNKMVVRFGDTSYDPTTKASADSFTSIVALNEPGVYEYTFNLSVSHHSWLFQSEWNDITNNPVDILQLTSDDQLMGTYYVGLFNGCSGLRSVWNIRGYLGSAQGWFRGCSNLEIVSGKIPERLDAVEYPSFSDVCIQLIYDASYMFYGCANLKRVELVLGFTDSDASNNISYCFHDDPKLQVGAAIIGYVADASYAYYSCPVMSRLYGVSDEPRLTADFWSEYNPSVVDVPSSALRTNISEMFYDCTAFRDFNGVTLRYGLVSNMEFAFQGCSSLTRIPSFNLGLDSNGNIAVLANNAFAGCISLEQVPELPYNRIKQASYLFSYCCNLIDLTPLLSIATSSLEYVNGICEYTKMASKGALELYNALSTTSTSLLDYSGAFANCGDCGWNDVRSQIPSAWGGMGA